VPQKTVALSIELPEGLGFRGFITACKEMTEVKRNHSSSNSTKDIGKNDDRPFDYSFPSTLLSSWDSP
jgi:hypothetical protein